MQCFIEKDSILRGTQFQTDQKIINRIVYIICNHTHFDNMETLMRQVFDKNKSGHLAALFTVFIWGMTFISTKVLLDALHPIAILFLRFVIGLIVLILIQPKIMKWQGIKTELRFMAAGLTGVTLYFLGENMALTYTYASNVSVITAVIPCLTAIACAIFFKEKDDMKPGFFIGFGIAIAGIIMISYNGVQLQLNPLGDLLIFFASIMWVAYSMLYRFFDDTEYTTVEITKRMFFYSLLSMIPLWFVFPMQFDFTVLTQPLVIGNLLFLGVIASGICYLTWNYGLGSIGSVKTSMYLYLSPVITVVFSIFILDEKITLLSGCGIVLTLAGLIVSQNHQKLRTLINKKSGE